MCALDGNLFINDQSQLKQMQMSLFLEFSFSILVGLTYFNIILSRITMLGLPHHVPGLLNQY